MAAAAYPPWVMFEQHGNHEVHGSSSIADANTLAACRTTAGLPISVSLCLAAPPEGSRVCVQLPGDVEMCYCILVAVHDDSVLVQAGRMKQKRWGTESTDLFVYNAGDVAAAPPRPPSLSLLAPDFAIDEYSGRPVIVCPRIDWTGLLRRGEDDFVVAQLRVEYVKVKDQYRRRVPELRLLRSGSGEWCAKRPAIITHNTDGGEADEDVVSSWTNNFVIPVGDRQLLCFVDRQRGLIFADVFAESPSLRYVPLPEKLSEASFRNRNVCLAGGGSTIKFVDVFPRCCCGGAGKTNCRDSRHAYAVHTWTLRMDDDDDMAWVMDGRLDATELWALDGYRGIPRVGLTYPVASLDEPDAICFAVCERHRDNDGFETMWWIIVDMKSKTLRSVFRYPEERRDNIWGFPTPGSRVSKYFNSKPSSSQQDHESMLNLTSTRIESSKRPKTETVQSAVLSSTCKSPDAVVPMPPLLKAASPEAAILAALQEIPGLDSDDMLKAYRILAHDDSRRRFRALMGLPMDLRKDCVLMEIKASEACVLCSACTADLRDSKKRMSAGDMHQ